MKRHFQCAADPTMIREWSEHDPSMIRPWSDHETVSPQPASQPRLPFTPTTNILYWKIQHFALRLSFQISPNTVPATKSDTRTSPNTAPATKKESHDWSLSHMKRYLQCAEQQVSLSKLTKYCACHEKWPSRISKKFAENGWNVISNARPIRAWSENDPSMIREWSEHDPTMKPSVRNPPRNRGYLSRPPRAFCIEKYNISRSGYHSKFHRHEKWHSNFTKYCACHEKRISWLILVTHETLFTMRGATSVIVQTHQILRLPRKMNLMIDPWHKWNVIYNARSNMRHSPNSPNTAPATKNDRPESQRNLLKTDETSFPMRGRSDHDPSMIRAWSEHDPTMKPSVRNPPRNRGSFSRPPQAFCIEKYNISRSGYHSKFHRILRLPRKVTLELHQILRLPRKVTLALHQILRLPRKVTLQLHQILRLPRK